MRLTYVCDLQMKNMNLKKKDDLNSNQLRITVLIAQLDYL